MAGGADAGLDQVLGQATIELLDAFVRSRVEEALARPDAERRWLSPAEAGAYLGCSAAAIRKRVARGGLLTSARAARF